MLRRIYHNTGRILASGNVRLLVSNISWQSLERGLRILAAMVTGLWMAAYLGPEKLGTYSYALAFVALFSPLITLGYDGFISRDLLLEKEKTDEILGSSALLRFLGGWMGILLIWCVITFTHWINDNAYGLILLLSVSFVFQSADVIDIYFRAKLLSKYASLARIAAMVIANAMKVALILMKASLMAFAAVYVFEYLAGGILLLFFYGYTLKERILGWRPSPGRLLFIFSESWPLLLSTFSYIIYTRIDQIMLGQMLNDTAVGIYSASIKFYEIPLALIMIVNASIYPFQARQYKENLTIFFKNYRLLTEAYTVASYVLFILVLIGADWFIKILPASFGEAAGLMRIHFIGLIFIFNAAVRIAYFSLAGHQRYILITTLSSALLNIALNYFLIPQYGIKGAAWATVITQFSSLLVLNILFRKTRKAFYIQIQGLLPIRLFRQLSLLSKEMPDAE